MTLEFLRGWLTALPGGSGPFVAALLAVAVALMAHWLWHRVATRIVAGRDLFWRSLVQRTRRPVRLAFVTLALFLALAPFDLPDGLNVFVRRALTVLTIVLIAWWLRMAFSIWMTIHLRQFSLDSEDNLNARKHITQGRILQRIGNILIYVGALAAVLMTFETVRHYGVSLLASAGAAGIVVGFALQPLLKNLIAGIQLAVTQPIRIDDALIVEGEWGQVEEITSTYVVIKIWDWRRLIVPLNYFIEQPFQNWTRETASLIGAVMLYVDHTADVARLREKAREVVEASPRWDRNVFAVQVTDIRETVMEVRVIASGRNAGLVYDLRCDIREALVAWLQAEMPGALPRTRAEVTSDPDRRPSAAAEVDEG
ncbi:mechanosensitive ion channel-like protein [Silicimonas algicola]|uniref:Mechanosensitive ion channel-like protein n=2 Tax=Silicimonas algicola TaxID=1826607 RepID=A0A316G1E3_9RHOB|nr:mechanosensitive ion channel family protein [Silicimonas algicola]PWK54774.1 mechanosensitive ion channel-like protein [Silicimonas algicola]